MIALAFNPSAAVTIAARQRRLFQPVYYLETLGKLLGDGFEGVDEELRQISFEERSDVAAVFVSLQSSRVVSDDQMNGVRVILAELNDAALPARRVAWLLISTQFIASSEVRVHLEEMGVSQLFIIPLQPLQPIVTANLPPGVPATVLPFERIASVPAALFYDEFCDEYAYTIIDPRAKQGVANTLARFGYSHYQLLEDASKIKGKLSESR